MKVHRPTFFCRCVLSLMIAVWIVPAIVSSGQEEQRFTSIRYGNEVPEDVDRIYKKGLEYLVAQQKENGSWGKPEKKGKGRAGQIGPTRVGPGVEGICVMAFLSSGEDPNYGEYAENIRAALGYIISSQTESGMLGAHMYHHGFAMLALAEAYGVVDEDLLWEGGNPNDKKSIGEALDLAVDSALSGLGESINWRYSENARGTDASIAGAMLMGLLAARNAGFDVPDSKINIVLSFYNDRTKRGEGSVHYARRSRFPPVVSRVAIATLLRSICGRKDTPEHKASLNHLLRNLSSKRHPWRHYNNYYMAQALYQADYEAWKKWNADLINTMKETQLPDGSFDDGFRGGTKNSYRTAMALLGLALNYRFLPICER